MLITVVIPFLNRTDTLRESLSGLACQSLDTNRFEVIAVDDGSSEKAEWLAESRYPFSLSLMHQHNSGPAGARNAGASSARGEILLFLDADIIPHEHLLAAHLEIHSNNRDLLAAGAVLPWKWGKPSWLDMVIDWELGDARKVYCEGLKSKFAPVPFYDAATQNLSIRKITFQYLGGFDQDLRGNEDVEFGYRAALEGLRIVYVPEAIGYHDHSRSLAECCNRHLFYPSYRPLLIKKHPEIRTLVPSWLDELPIDWRRDPPGLIRKKLLRQLLSFAPILGSMRWAATLVEGRRVSPRLLRWLYWKLIPTYEYLGFREGWQRYGP